MLSFDRMVKQLQVVEAIRDHTARTGQLPKDLGDLTLYAPHDPLTGQPFDYSISSTLAVLSTPKIPGVEEALQQSKSYRLKVAAIDN